MSLFKRKRQIEEDPRSEIEKKFEEKGQKIGLKTGSIVQKGVDKYEKVKNKLEDDGTLDKIRDFGNKIDDKIDQVVDTVTQKSKEVVTKIKKKKDVETSDDFYK